MQPISVDKLELTSHMTSNGGNNRYSPSWLLEKFTRFVDDNKRVITYALYGTAAAGFLIAFKSLKISSQFKKIEDIPNDFIRKNYNIFGFVEKSSVVLEDKRNKIQLLINHD